MKLILRKRAEVVLEYLIRKERISVGRTEGNDVRIDDLKVSETHALFSKKEGKYFIEDLKTSFGTFLNGQKVSSQEVREGDEIGLGEHVLMLWPEKKDTPLQPLPKLYYLAGIHGKFMGRKYILLRGETKIGRSDDLNDIILSGNIDPTVSRRHTTIMWSAGDRLILSDRRSRNRTFVNKVQVNETDEIPITPGDEVLIGKSIFRLFEEGKERWNPPAKAAPFFVKLQYIIRFGFLLILFLGGAYFSFMGMKGTKILNPPPGRIDFNKINFLPFPVSPPSFVRDTAFPLVPSPVIGDINGDGMNDFLGISQNGEVFLVRGSDRQALWRKNIESYIFVPALVSDLDYDGRKEIIVAAADSRLYVLDGKTGDLFYKSSLLGGKLNTPIAEDLNRDGHKEIILSNDVGRVFFISLSPETNREETVNLPEGVLVPPALIRVDSLPRIVALAGTGGKIYLINLLGGKPSPEVEILNLVEKNNALKGTYFASDMIKSPMAVGDVTGDGADDLVFFTYNYLLGVVDGRKKDVVWVELITPYSEQDAPYHSAPALADLTGDRIPDVLYAAPNGRIFAFEGSRGKKLWEYEPETPNSFFAPMALADFSKNGRPEIVSLDTGGNLVILNSQGKMIFNSNLGMNPFTSGAVLADLTGAGRINLACQDTADVFYILESSIPSFSNEVLWGMNQGDGVMSGLYNYDLTGLRTRYRKMVLAGSAVFLLAAFYYIIWKRRRKRNRPAVLTGKSK